jgi:hypothetical protein
MPDVTFSTHDPGQARQGLAVDSRQAVRVVRVRVDAVIPDADPSEPCFEPPAVKWMDELQRLADDGDVAALEKVGEVFVRRSALNRHVDARHERDGQANPGGQVDRG